MIESQFHLASHPNEIVFPNIRTGLDFVDHLIGVVGQ